MLRLLPEIKQGRKGGGMHIKMWRLVIATVGACPYLALLCGKINHFLYYSQTALQTKL